MVFCCFFCLLRNSSLKERRSKVKKKGFVYWNGKGIVANARNFSTLQFNTIETCDRFFVIVLAPTSRKETQNEKDTSLEVSLCRKMPRSLADKKANLPRESSPPGKETWFRYAPITSFYFTPDCYADEPAFNEPSACFNSVSIATQNIWYKILIFFFFSK